MTKKIIEKYWIVFLFLTVLWGYLFWSLFFYSIDDSKVQLLLSQNNSAYQDSLSQLKQGDNASVILGMFSFVSALMVEGMLGLSFYLRYRDDVVIFKVNHFSFRKSNGIMITAFSCITGIAEAIGLLFSVSFVSLHDRVILNLPCIVHYFPDLGYWAIALSLVFSGLIRYLALVLPFSESRLLNEIRRMQR
ncbi:MAG: hypothetical protein LKM30_02885 [Bacilli bacterium]|jgi:hypothetical protein|nr:hypothetical protein [Bacilli bacterium]